MKRKMLNLLSFLLFWGSLLYILGQAGSMDLNQISIPQYIIRTSIGLVILAADTVLINYLGGEEGEQMSTRSKHKTRSRKSRDESRSYKTYVKGNMPLYDPDYNLIHRFTGLFKHQSR